MKSWAIRNATGFFFSLVVAKMIGQPGWTEARDDALQFARAADADEFLRIYLKHVPSCEVVAL